MNNLHTSIELSVIEAVRKRRLALNIDAKDLSLKIGLDGGFVGKVENPNKRDKYNLNHLNEISKILECKISDLLPDPQLQEDCIKEYRKIHPPKARKQK